MHYYSFNIGDYASHTRHLDLLEDLAYRRILDLYYLHEQPLNECSTTVARLINMRKHVAEVELVLNEFFLLEKGVGWTHARADAEIAKFHSKLESASKAGKASAERRANIRSTVVQPNKNQETGNKKQEPERESPQPAEEPPPVETKKPARVARASQLPADFQLTEASVDYARIKRVDLNTEFQSFVNWHSAKGSTYKDWQAAWRSWCDKASVYNKNRPQKTEHQIRQDATARALFGDNPFAQTLKTIEGEVLNATENSTRLLG